MLVMLVIFIIQIIFIYLHSFLQFVTKGEKREHCTVMKYLKRTIYILTINTVIYCLTPFGAMPKMDETSTNMTP